MNATQAPPSLADEEQHDNRRLQELVSLLLALASTLLTPVLFLFSDNPYEAAAGLLSTVLSWLIYRQVRLGRRRRTALLLNICVFVVAVAATLAFGSVRNAANFLFLGVVVGAGIFFSRRTLVGIVTLVLLTLALLTLAETHGLLRTPDQHVGLKTWITQAMCLVVVALLVYRNRLHVENTTRRLREALELRQRTEQERNRSLDRFARIFRNSPSPMLAQSARNGMILDVNPAFERCYGYQRDQVLGRPDTLLWADPQDRIAYLDTLIEDRRTERVPARSRRADNTVFDALVSSEMSDDPDDRLVITTVIDVSDQNAALDRLKKSEARFAKAFNFSPLNMTITRLSDGTFLEVNRATNEVQGHDPQDLVGITAQAAGVWADAAAREAFVAVLRRDGHVHGYETRMQHRDGHQIDTRIWAEVIEIEGEDCILSCAIDVSAEKRREAQLMALTRGMAGPSGDALFQALTLHMAQAIGADMVTVSERRTDGQMRTLAVWKDGASAANHSYELRDCPCQVAMEQTHLFFVPDGLAQRFPAHASTFHEDLQAYVGQSLRDEDGSPIGVLSAFWRQALQLPDDTRALIAIFASRATAELIRLRRDREIRRLNSSLEERVRERTAELEKLNVELDSFAYSVSHDLKSPLRAIDGFTELLQASLEDRLRDDERQLMQRVLAATARMSKLIADLLTLARISQGVLERAPVNLSAMAQQILEREQAQHPDRRLRWRIAPDLRDHVDARLARIALENLLGNAVKYTRDRAVADIEFGHQPGQPGAFFIRDNGIGFDMALEDKLFKPFQRLHLPSSGFEGTGIGLAAVHRVLERHGGRIAAQSRPGHGALFTFSFSAAPRPPERLPAPATATNP